MKTWVIVASAARARLFETANGRGPLEEMKDWVNPQEPLPAQALVSDKPGRAFDTRGGQRHAMEPPQDPKETVAARFAARLADELRDSLSARRFDTLCVVAPPHFLGLLRAKFGDDLQRAVSAELVKDLTREDARRIGEEIAALR